MASQKNLIKMRCSVCRQGNYYTNKNKKTIEGKLTLSKYCSNCRTHKEHKEAKITA